MLESGRGGLLVPERDPEALASAIASIVENRAQREELASQTSSYTVALSEKQWERNLLATIENVI